MTYADDSAGEGRMVVRTVPVATLVEREDFWADTCREIPQMQHASAEAVDLYRQHGCRFCTPARQQIECVLNALDAAVPRWEKEHPELFYQTLELNYPELVRRA